MTREDYWFEIGCNGEGRKGRRVRKEEESAMQ